MYNNNDDDDDKDMIVQIYSWGDTTLGSKDVKYEFYYSF